MKELELINEKLQELTKVVQNLMAEEGQLLATLNAIFPDTYLDSTGKIIDQPEILLIVKENPEFILAAYFEDGSFKSPHSYTFNIPYEAAEKKYYIIQTGDRIACLKTNCLLNKYHGCTIKPMLSIGLNFVVDCGSYLITPKKI